MKIKPVTLGEIKKQQLKHQKKLAAEAAEKRLNAYIKKIVSETFPKDAFIRDRNICESNQKKSITAIIQGYMGKLDANGDIFAPWGNVK